MDIPRPLGGVPSVLLNDALTPPDNLPPAESDAANPPERRARAGRERKGQDLEKLTMAVGRGPPSRGPPNAGNPC